MLFNHRYMAQLLSFPCHALRDHADNHKKYTSILSMPGTTIFSPRHLYVSALHTQFYRYIASGWTRHKERPLQKCESSAHVRNVQQTDKSCVASVACKDTCFPTISWLLETETLFSIIMDAHLDVIFLMVCMFAGLVGACRYPKVDYNSMAALLVFLPLELLCSRLSAKRVLLSQLWLRAVR